MSAMRKGKGKVKSMGVGGEERRTEEVEAAVSSTVQIGVTRALEDGVVGVLVEGRPILELSTAPALGSVLDTGDGPSTLSKQTSQERQRVGSAREKEIGGQERGEENGRTDWQKAMH
jgi:hypothetical protein